MLAHVVADRIALREKLRSAGPGLLSGLLPITVAGGAVAALAGGVAHRGALAGVATTTLLADLALLLPGHVSGAVREPLSALVRRHRDDDDRAEMSRIAAMSATIAALERADVLASIHRARAARRVSWPVRPAPVRPPGWAGRSRSPGWAGRSRSPAWSRTRGGRRRR